MTVRNLGVEERSGGRLLLRNWREMLQVEDKFVGEGEKEEESLTLSELLERREEAGL